MGEILERSAWLERRRHGIGSTDAAAILGKSPFKTALHVYLDKRGEINTDDEENEAMLWGRILEDPVAQFYAAKTGYKVSRPPQSIYVHPEHPELVSSIDRVVEDGHDAFILECKNAGDGYGWGQEGSDDIPDHYLIQVQHQMMVTGYRRADVAALLHGTRFRRYIVLAVPGLHKTLSQIERDFWRKIQAGDAPDIEWDHPATADLLKRMYGVDDDLRIDLAPGALALVKEYLLCHNEVRAAEQKKERMKLELLALMQRAAYAHLADGTTLHRKRISRQGYTVEPTSYVSFSVKPSEEMKSRVKPF